MWAICSSLVRIRTQKPGPATSAQLNATRLIPCPWQTLVFRTCTTYLTSMAVALLARPRQHLRQAGRQLLAQLQHPLQVQGLLQHLGRVQRQAPPAIAFFKRTAQSVSRICITRALNDSNQRTVATSPAPTHLPGLQMFLESIRSAPKGPRTEGEALSRNQDNGLRH